MDQQNTPTLQCHRCCQLFDASVNEFGNHEYLSIRFRAGINSVFREYALFECNLCPRCLKKLLGKYFSWRTSIIYELQKKLLKNPDLDSDDC